MSNLLKSKILLGVMIFAVMFVGVVVVSASTASASDCDYGSVTLRQGMSGAGVTCLQTNLAVTPVTGYFGTITKGKVLAFQSANQLVADGIVGPATKAALGLISSVSGGTLPAGCTSTTGFSTTTGASCAATTLPAGCTSTAGFSPTTGASCSTGTASTSLSGGAGEIDSIDQVTTSVKSDVLEGASDVKVLGFDIAADSGSDLAISSIRLNFEEQAPLVGTESDRLSRYIDEVTVWVGSTKVGSADVDDFSESSDIYSKSISLNGVKIEAGEEIRMYVAVSANSVIDSADFDADWEVELESIRTLDASGAIMTETGMGLPLTEIFEFEDLASSGDLAFRVSKASTSPTTESIKIDDNGETDVDMLEFKLKAEGSDMTVDELDFSLTSVGNNIFDMVSEVKLVLGDDEIDTVSTLAAATTDTITFTDLASDLEIEEGDTVTLKVVATMKEINGVDPFASGSSLVVSLTAADRNNADVEDSEGDSILAADRVGSAGGEALFFFVEGVTVTVKSATTTVTAVAGPVATDPDTVEFNWVLDVAAFGGNDVYINADFTDVLDAAGVTFDMVYGLEYSGGATPLAAVGATITESDSDVTLITADAGAYGAAYAGETFFKIDADAVGTFTINISGTNAGEAKQVRALLNSIEWTTDIVDATTLDAEVATINTYTSNLDDVSDTPFKAVN